MHKSIYTVVTHFLRYATVATYSIIVVTLYTPLRHTIDLYLHIDYCIKFSYNNNNNNPSKDDKSENVFGRENGKCFTFIPNMTNFMLYILSFSLSPTLSTNHNYLKTSYRRTWKVSLFVKQNLTHNNFACHANFTY